MPPDSRIYFDPPATEPRAFAGQKGGAAKAYLQKVAKLVPIEIVGAYESAILLASKVDPEKARIYVYWILFGLAFLGTLWYVGWRIGENYFKQRHLFVYGAAFIVWAYAVSGQRLLPSPYYQDTLAGIVLIIASVIFGRIKLPAKEKPPKKRNAE